MIPDPSDRERYLDALKARLEAISTTHPTIDFATDAGAHVHLGELASLGPDDPEQAIAMIVDDDVLVFQGEALTIDVPVRIQALIPAAHTHPYRDAESVLADIKRAVELEDRRFGNLIKHTNGILRGATRTIRREEGNPFVGVEIEYTARLHEDWGSP